MLKRKMVMEKMKMTSKDLVSERLEIISKLCPG